MFNFFSISAKKPPTHARGRRKSVELEDLDQSSTGSLSLPAHLRNSRGLHRSNSKTISEEDEDSVGSLEDIKSKRAANPKPKRTLSDNHFMLATQSSRGGAGEHKTEKPKSTIESKPSPMRRANSEKGSMGASRQRTRLISDPPKGTKK